MRARGASLERISRHVRLAYFPGFDIDRWYSLAAMGCDIEGGFGVHFARKSLQPLRRLRESGLFLFTAVGGHVKFLSFSEGAKFNISDITQKGIPKTFGPLRITPRIALRFQATCEVK